VAGQGVKLRKYEVSKNLLKAEKTRGVEQVATIGNNY
jgi:hypothetical protein